MACVLHVVPTFHHMDVEFASVGVRPADVNDFQIYKAQVLQISDDDFNAGRGECPAMTVFVWLFLGLLNSPLPFRKSFFQCLQRRGEGARPLCWGPDARSVRVEGVESTIAEHLRGRGASSLLMVCL